MATVDIKRNKQGVITGYRFRCCVGRENDGKGKQVWRTSQQERPDMYTGKSQSKAEEKEINRLADNWEKAQKEEYQRTHSKTDKKKIGFSDFVSNVWFPNHVQNGKHSPNGVSFFKSTSKTSVDYFKNKKLSQITPEDITKYLKYLSTEATGSQGEKYSAASQKHHLGTLHNIFSYAWRYDYIQENPVEKLESSEKPKAEKKQIDFLSPDDAKRFLHCLDAEYQNAALSGETGSIRKNYFWKLYGYLLITAGLRRGEAIDLKWSDIDSGRMMIHISRSVCPDKASPTKMTIKSTKTGGSRSVPLLQELLEMFSTFKAIEDNYFDHRTEAEKKESPESYKLPDDTFVFCSEADPYIPLYCTTPTRYLSKFVKRNNLPDVSPHDLRHTAASLALESGSNMKQIAELMGHTDIGTTAAFYAALTSAAKRRTVEGIGGLLFGTGQDEQS